jgi:hypothetical protein
MPEKYPGPEQILTKLRQAEFGLPKGVEIVQVCRRLEVTQQTDSR